MEIINYRKRDIIPLTQEENDLYNEQEICYACKKMFCVDKMIKIILIEKRLKIIVIIQENLEDLSILYAI